MRNGKKTKLVKLAKLFEEFVENAESNLKDFQQKVLKHIMVWFETGELGTRGYVLENVSDMEKWSGKNYYLRIDFSKNEYQGMWKITLGIDTNSTELGDPDKMWAEIKKFSEDGVMIGVHKETIETDTFSPEWIFDSIEIIDEEERGLVQGKEKIKVNKIKEDGKEPGNDGSSEDSEGEPEVEEGDDLDFEL